MCQPVERNTNFRLGDGHGFGPGSGPGPVHPTNHNGRQKQNNSRVGLVLGLIAFVISVTLVGAGLWLGRHARSSPQHKPVQVVASMGIFADMAANVGGDAVEVRALIPAGADPHAWEPSIREMRALAGADVFIYNGLGLEPWLERTLAAAAAEDLRLVELSAGLPTLGDTHLHVDGHHFGGDPHMWLDLRNGILYVRRIEAALVEAAPHATDDIRRRAAAYVAQLEELDKWFQAQVDAIPPQRRVLVTDHDAYVYMAERYGLQRAGFVTTNPDREPSAREMAQLAAAIRASGAPALFAEPHVGTTFIDELARETGLPVGVLYTDAFFGHVTTYVEMMRANGNALRSSLAE